MKFTVPVSYDQETDEYFIEFPEEVINKLSWKVGDKIKWDNNNDGSFTLTKNEKESLQPVVYKYVSTKEFVDDFPVAYKQWKADTHCNLNHGYSFTFKLFFGANELDKRGWVVDYGGFKELKEVLKEQFDHKTLIAQDDPDLEDYKELEKKGFLKLTVLPAMGCELIADMLYKYINGVYIPDMWGPGEAERVWCYRVEVRETQSNMAWREGHREWNEDLFNNL